MKSNIVKQKLSNLSRGKHNQKQRQPKSKRVKWSEKESFIAKKKSKRAKK